MELTDKIFQAIEHRQIDKVLSLTNNNYQFSGHNEEGNSIVTDVVLSAIMDSSEIKFLEKILKAGFDPNVLNADSSTALKLAVKSQEVRLVELLTRYGARVSKDGSTDNNSLHEACMSGIEAIVEILLTNCPYDLINSVNNLGNSPIMVAVSYGNYETCQLLCKKNADLKIKDDFGNSALHLAAELKDKSIYHFLAQNGADVNEVNDLGLSAAEISKESMEEPLARPKPLKVLFTEYGL